MALGTEVGLGLGHIVVDGDPALLPQRGETPPHFSAHFYCGQRARCITMPLSMKVGLSPGDIVFNGDPAPPQKGGVAPSPIFGLCLLWRNGWMYQDGTWQWQGGGP